MKKSCGCVIVIKHKDLASEPCENCGSKLVFHDKRKVGNMICHEFQCGTCGFAWQYNEKAKKEDD